MDEPPAVNGRVSSRGLYAAISSLREELASAQRAQAADVMAAVAATERRLSARIERLEATVNAHDDLIQQLRGARNLLMLIFGASVPFETRACLGDSTRLRSLLSDVARADIAT